MQREVLRRIGSVETAREHRDGAGLERGFVHARIDAARHAGDDDETKLAQFTRKLRGEFLPGSGGFARADDGDEGLCEECGVATYGDQRRTWIDLREQCGVVRLATGDEARAHVFERFDFRFDGVGGRGNKASLGDVR